jgi:hypothetical protein
MKGWAVLRMSHEESYLIATKHISSSLKLLLSKSIKKLAFQFKTCCRIAELKKLPNLIL